MSQLREKSVDYRAQLTLSIGVGEGTENLIDLGELSQIRPRLSIGRGGDQVAIKSINGNVCVSMAVRLTRWRNVLV